MKKVLILGGKGEGAAVSEFIELCGDFEVLGFLNDFEPAGTLFGKYSVLGSSNEWKKFGLDCCFVFAMQRYFKMHERYEKLKSLGIAPERFPNIIHPLTYISKSSLLGTCGVVIYPFVSIHNSSVVGNFCSVRSGANIGHDCRIGEFNCIGPNAVLSGYAETEEGVYIAPNVTVNNSVKLKRFSMAGSNSVIYKNIEEYEIYQGNPARYIGKTDEQNV